MSSFFLGRTWSGEHMIKIGKHVGVFTVSLKTGEYSRTEVILLKLECAKKEA